MKMILSHVFLNISHKRVLYLKTVPDETCLTCADKDFCRLKDKTKQKAECVCPDMNEGDFSEISLWQTFSILQV